MSKPNIPYEEKKFMFEFLDIWSKYGKPPIKIYTNHLDSYDKGNGKIDGLPQSFLLEVLDLASECQTPARLECMGIKGSYKTPYTYMMEAGEEEDDTDDEEDTVTDYSEEDDDDIDEPVTDYDVENDGEEVSDDDTDQEPTDEENNNEGEDTTNEDTGNEEEIEDPDAITDYDSEDEPSPESEEGESDEASDGETLDDISTEDGETSDNSDEVTDYDSESGGEEGGMMSDTTSSDETTSEDSSTEEESNSSDSNVLIKNFSLMNDFEKIYALITDNISMVNTTLKAEPSQNRVLVQISKNLSNIKDFVLTFIQFYFKHDNYQFNLYYYEVVVQLLKLNLSMLEKSFNLRKN